MPPSGLSKRVKRKLRKENKTLNVAIPKEWADLLGLDAGQKVEIAVNHDIDAIFAKLFSALIFMPF